MGEKKTTVFEINVENFDFNPDTGGLERVLGGAGGSDEESTGSGLDLFDDEGEGVEEDVEIDDEEATEVDVEDEEDAEDGSGGIGVVIGLLFLLIVAVVAKKFVLDSEPEEYEEVELSDYEN